MCIRDRGTVSIIPSVGYKADFVKHTVSVYCSVRMVIPTMFFTVSDQVRMDLEYTIESHGVVPFKETCGSMATMFVTDDPASHTKSVIFGM